MQFKKALETLIAHEDLTETRTADILAEIFTGDVPPATVAGFLAALAVKGETAAELTGAARAMRSRMRRIQTPGSITVDTCGTGGDGSDTFNISTTAAFVVAGCGVTVAKHGNRSVSSKCGSADVLESLGVTLAIDAEMVEEALFEIGIGFLFAPNFHAAVRHAGPARQALGVRTLFNAIGPMANPAGAGYQVIGVFRPDLTETMGEALLTLGTKRAFVVHGHDGLDEISVCAPTRITEVADGRIKTYDLHPDRYFGEMADPEDLKGGDAPTNAAITRRILEGEKGPKRNIILLNAAAALVAAGKAETMEAGIAMARTSIDSGAAKEKLDALIRFTREATDAA